MSLLGFAAKGKRAQTLWYSLPAPQDKFQVLKLLALKHLWFTVPVTGKRL
jgi:hypothetical protein